MGYAKTGGPPATQSTPPTPGDDGVEIGPADATTTLGDSFDEPLLTDIETGAIELLSTAFWAGISNPFASAQGGWMSGPQDIDSYTNVASASGAPGRVVDSCIGMVLDDANSNSFTGGQNVNALTGEQNSAEQDSLPAPKSQFFFSVTPVDDSAASLPKDTSPAPSGQSATPSPVQPQPVEPDMGAHNNLTPDEKATLVARYAQYDAELAASQGRGGSTIPAAETGGSTAAAPSSTASPAVPDWTTQTEWAFPKPDSRLFQPVTSVDTGNRPLNFLLNKVLLPWRNLFAFTENIPIAMALGLDDALKHSPLQMEYQAAQDMLPLEGALGLTMEVGPALDYALTSMSTSPRLRGLATAPAYWAMGAGDVGGGITAAPQSARTALNAAGELPAFGAELRASLRPLTTIQELIDEGWQYHHWFPQELAERFHDLGIDVHQYTTLLPQEFHIAELHGEGWNAKWLDWLEEAEENGYTAEDAVEHLYELLQPYVRQLEEIGVTGPNGMRAVVPYPGRQ